MEGLPHPWLGGTPIQSRPGRGIPHPRLDGSTPSPSGPGWGTPCQVGVCFIYGEDLGKWFNLFQNATPVNHNLGYKIATLTFENGYIEMITFASYIQIQNSQFYTSALWRVDDKGSVVVGRELARPIRRRDQFDVVVFQRDVGAKTYHCNIKISVKRQMSM